MSVIKTIRALYVSGHPWLCDDGFWHVEWIYKDGTTHITKFGWKDIDRAEKHIDVILAELDNAFLVER
jgi:hypothetical protein